LLADIKKKATSRAQQYAQQYAAEAKSLIDLKRKSRKEGGFYVEPEAKILLVIRIRG
jgi:large subunit ribosomal protein L7e